MHIESTINIILKKYRPLNAEITQHTKNDDIVSIVET